MFETMVIVIAVVIVVGAGILAWWFENGPESKDDSKNSIEIKENEER